jgi:hypothetical protein
MFHYTLHALVERRLPRLRAECSSELGDVGDSSWFSISNFGNSGDFGNLFVPLPLPVHPRKIRT